MNPEAKAAKPQAAAAPSKANGAGKRTTIATSPKPASAAQASPKRAVSPARSQFAGRSLPDPFERDSFASTAAQEIMDRALHATAARLTAGLSPSALAGACADWAVHLATSPGKQVQLAQKAAKKWMRLANYAGTCALNQDGAEPCITPLPQDRRFRGSFSFSSPPAADLGPLGGFHSNSRVFSFVGSSQGHVNLVDMLLF